MGARWEREGAAPIVCDDCLAGLTLRFGLVFAVVFAVVMPARVVGWVVLGGLSGGFTERWSKELLVGWLRLALGSFKIAKFLAGVLRPAMNKRTSKDSPAQDQFSSASQPRLRQ